MNNSSDKAVKLKLRALMISLITISLPIMSTISFYITLGIGDVTRWTVLILLMLGCIVHQVMILTDALSYYDIMYPNNKGE